MSDESKTRFISSIFMWPMDVIFLTYPRKTILILCMRVKNLAPVLEGYIEPTIKHTHTHTHTLPLGSS